MMEAPSCDASGSAPTSSAATLLSRIIYGARTALIVGFASAFVGGVVGLVLGVGQRLFRRPVRPDLPARDRRADGLPADHPGAGRGRDLRHRRAERDHRHHHPADPALRAAWCARARWRSARCPMSMRRARCGFSHARIILRHMVPNVMAPFLIMLTAFVGQAILAEASLSYLGLGVQEPVPAWGLMLQGGAEEYADDARRGSRSSRASPSCSPCSASTCSATRCATRSIRSCGIGSAEPHNHLTLRSGPTGRVSKGGPQTSTFAHPSRRIAPRCSSG